MLRNKFRKIHLLVMYYLTKFDNVIQSGFWVNSKNSICKFMQANLWHHKLFHFHLPFWIWKVWRGREKITKIWLSRERKELFRWNVKKEAVSLLMSITLSIYLLHPKIGKNLVLRFSPKAQHLSPPIELILETLKFDRKNYDLYQPLRIILTNVRHI